MLFLRLAVSAQVKTAAAPRFPALAFAALLLAAFSFTAGQVAAQAPQGGTAASPPPGVELPSAPADAPGMAEEEEEEEGAEGCPYIPNTLELTV